MTVKKAEPPLTKATLFAFPIDVDATLAHLKVDMRDDWFPDPLLYQDLFAQPDNLREVLSELLLRGNGQYPASAREAYDIPKSSHGLRYSLETDFYDRFMHQAICTYLIPFFDPLLSNRVLGHRYNAERRREKYLFKHRIDLWNTFQGITRAAVNVGDTLLCTDLINYFENIQVSQIVSALRSRLPEVNATGTEKVLIRNAISTLEILLTSWCYSERHGLPQNRDASSFLANVVLDEVDRSMVALGYDYFRYVDDIRVICNDERQARRGLVDLVRELRKINLNINSSKTDIVSKQSDEAVMVAYFPAMDDRVVAIDNMWRSRSKRVIARSIPLLHELMLDLVRNQQTQTRQFRFCVNRLKTLIEANVFDCSSILTLQIEEALYDLLISQPVSTDQVCKILEHSDARAPVFAKIEQFLLDPGAAIHDWQNYQLWLLLAFHRHQSGALIDVASAEMATDVIPAQAAAQFVYLARCGKIDRLERLIPKMRAEWPYQCKRLFLLSLADAEQTKLSTLRAKLCPKTTGTIRRFKGNPAVSDGIFFRPKSTGISDLFDRLNPYD